MIRNEMIRKQKNVIKDSPLQLFSLINTFDLHQPLVDCMQNMKIMCKYEGII